MSTHAPQDAEIRSLAEAHAAEAGALLPILHAIQDRLGYVPETAVPIVADVLNLSRAEVHGVVTFYHDFRDKPAGQRRADDFHAQPAMRQRLVVIRDGLAIDRAT